MTQENENNLIEILNNNDIHIYDKMIAFCQLRNIENVKLSGLPIHKHHIIPKHENGNNDQSNLVVVNIVEHGLLHGFLFLKNQNKKDFSAFSMLSGSTKSIRELAGKRAAEVCREKRVNAFFDPKLKFEISSKGGKIGGQINAKSGHLTKISRDTAAQRSIKMSNKRWWTDGINNLMLNKDILPPNNFYRGKTQTK